MRLKKTSQWDKYHFISVVTLVEQGEENGGFFSMHSPMILGILSKVASVVEEAHKE